MTFTKKPVSAIALSIVLIALSVVTFIFIQVAGKIEGSSTGSSPLAIIMLAFGILLTTSLSTQKPLFTKIVLVVGISSITLAAFIIAIVCASDFQNNKIGWDTITFLSLGILSFISTVLFLVYFLIGRKETIEKIASVANIVSLVLFAILAIVTIFSGFFGIYKYRPFYAIELALLLGTISTFLGINLSLKNVLIRE